MKLSPRPASSGRRSTFALLALLGLVLAACGSVREEDIVIEGSVEDLYNRASDLASNDKWKEAARFYNEVDRQHPYSPWASRAQLMAAFSYYKEREYDTAVTALNRFIRLHPSHRDIAYAHYLKAMCFFDQLLDTRRDQTHAADATKAFEEVVKRFPETRYAQDSRQKLVLVQDHLAGHEMQVGRYYQRRGQHLAAINRFKVVIEKHQTSRQVPEALHRLTESYTAIGAREEARRVAAVLSHNFPSSDWYQESYELVEQKPLGRRGAAPPPGGLPPPGSAAPAEVAPPPERRGWMRRSVDWLF